MLSGNTDILYVKPDENDWVNISNIIGKIFTAEIEANTTVAIEFSNDGKTPITTIPPMTLGRQAHIVTVYKQWQTNFPARYFRWTQTGTTSTVEISGYNVELPENVIAAQEIEERAIILLKGITVSGYMWAGGVTGGSGAIYDPFVKEVLISVAPAVLDFRCVVERALLNDGNGLGVPQHTGGLTFNVSRGGGLYDNGAATAGGAATITDNRKNWVAGSLIGRWIEHGTDKMRIINNTATVITANANFAVLPIINDPYTIRGSGVGISPAEYSLGKWGGAVYAAIEGNFSDLVISVQGHRIY